VSATRDVARMLTLVPWLLVRPGASVQETADAFGVDATTIRRDLGHLDFCGLPGLGGGDLFDVSIVGDRIVVGMADELRRPLRLTPSEALRLVLTVDAVAEVLSDEVPALRSAVDKLRAALDIPERAADVLTPRGSSLLDDARQAVTSKRRIELHYQGRADDAPQSRLVDPWALHVLDGAWYLQGHDLRAGDGRTFRLDRIAELRICDEAAEVAAPTRLPAPRYSPGADDLEVTLRLDVRGRWLLDAIEVESLEDLPDGGVRVRFHTDAPGWVARLVLMAGGYAVVESPAELSVHAAGLARDALALYVDVASDPETATA
jgi:proteasome accessory factor C